FVDREELADFVRVITGLIGRCREEDPAAGNRGVAEPGVEAPEVRELQQANAVDQKHLVYVRTVRGSSRKRDESDPRLTARHFEVRKDDPTLGGHRGRRDILDHAAAVRVDDMTTKGPVKRKRVVEDDALGL